MGIYQSISVVDSHTAGEPTRVVLGKDINLGNGSLAEMLQRFRAEFDGLRSGIIREPRGSEAVVGALLLEPMQPDCTAAVIFFNDVGYLGMCGHGTIGLVTTLAHLGRIRDGEHRIETPVGIVSTRLHEDGSVTVQNVPSRRFRANVPLDVRGVGRFIGDIAWGGNWFFLVADHGYKLDSSNRAELMDTTIAIRNALREQKITGENNEEIDHIELMGEPADPANSSRNFVLCPGNAFDRSPCGTGTSAKMACLYADGKLKAGEIWRQESILGTVFEGSFSGAEDSFIIPSIRGTAWITGESTLHFHENDPFAKGIHF
jgi:4-hydroxyproline epimerase